MIKNKLPKGSDVFYDGVFDIMVSVQSVPTEESTHVGARRCSYRAEEPSGLTLLEDHIFQRGCVAVCFGCSEFRLLEKQPGRSSSEDDEDFPCRLDSSSADATLNGGGLEKVWGGFRTSGGC